MKTAEEVLDKHCHYDQRLYRRDTLNAMEEYSSEKDKEIERLKGLIAKAWVAGADFGEDDGYGGTPNFTQWKKQQGL